MKINGQGGFWVLQANGTFTRVDNAEHTIDIDTLIDDVTDSSATPNNAPVAGGIGLVFAQGLPCLLKLNSIEMSVAEDNLASPFLLGFQEGNVVSFFLKRGAIESFDFVENTIFRSSRVLNPQDKARRLTLTFEYGVYSRNVNGPPGF